MYYITIRKEDWHRSLENLLSSHDIFVPVKDEFSIDNEPFRPDHADEIAYNIPKPVTPLKNFFLPVRENVTIPAKNGRPRIIIGVPNCDVTALALLDEIYLDEAFTDPFYRERRNNTLIIAADCHSVNEHCHCTSYGIRPWSEGIADMALVSGGDYIYLRIITGRGAELAKQFPAAVPVADPAEVLFAEEKHKEVEISLAALK
jgi:hypothetical protein